MNVTRWRDVLKRLSRAQEELDAAQAMTAGYPGTFAATCYSLEGEIEGLMRKAQKELERELKALHKK